MNRSAVNQPETIRWEEVCSSDDILPETGVGALVGQSQVAIFRTADNSLYALDNYDPFSHANVLARGILGSIGEKRVVASPLYKQHFCLTDGSCIEDERVFVTVWPVRQRDGMIEVGCAS